jgi:coenzyme PQQ precursor peptide PqqA
MQRTRSHTCVSTQLLVAMVRPFDDDTGAAVHALGRRADASAGGDRMNWIKPEFKEVAVTLEVTAYAGRK